MLSSASSNSALICGVDEAGRGPLAGPVYAAAVILNPERRINGLADSKVLTPERREVLAERIKERALAWSIASASVEEIDRINILRASLLAMKRAVETLGIEPGEVCVDGNQVPAIRYKCRAIVRGDQLVAAISAASILAKVARDAEMTLMEERYPGYGFSNHKGYSTPEHMAALRLFGPCEIHRRSFYAVRIFFQGDLFAPVWSSMTEELRIRSYRMCCDATKLAMGTALIGQRAKLDKFDRERKRLQRSYADVRKTADAAAHVDLVDQMLRKARHELRAKRPN